MGEGHSAIVSGVMQIVHVSGRQCSGRQVLAMSDKVGERSARLSSVFLPSIRLPGLFRRSRDIKKAQALGNSCSSSRRGVTTAPEFPR